MPADPELPSPRPPQAARAPQDLGGGSTGPSPSPDTTDRDVAPVPTSIEEYEILSPLGRGGMGQVFRAHDTLLDRPVAIKLISSADPSERARERFLIEARAIARLQHPNVVSIYRVGVQKGRPYIVSELVAGQSLDRLPRPVPWMRALPIAIGIARGLTAAHRHGVLHRDIKPANVMLAEDGTVKLLDFGLAKLTRVLSPTGASSDMVPPIAADLGLLGLDGDTPRADGLDPVLLEALANTMEHEPGPHVQAGWQAGWQTSWTPNQPSLTVFGSIMGTPGYMSPEVWRGEAATARSDLYSFGALLFERRHPVEGLAPGVPRSGAAARGARRSAGEARAAGPGALPARARHTREYLRSHASCWYTGWHTAWYTGWHTERRGST